MVSAVCEGRPRGQNDSSSGKALGCEVKNNHQYKRPEALMMCSRDGPALGLTFKGLKYHAPQRPELHEGTRTRISNPGAATSSAKC